MYQKESITYKDKETITNKSPEIKVVDVGKIQAIPLLLTEEYIGYVSPIKSVEVRPYIEGFIAKTFVSGGEVVKTGMPLFLLEQGQYLADLELKKANIAKANAVFENANSYYERMLNAGKDAISESNLEQAQADLFTSVADLISAVAAYKSSKVMYDYTFVNAPIDGFLGNVSITEGQYVSPSGSVLAYVVQQSPIRVVFSISNRDYLSFIKSNPDNPLKNKRIKLRLANGELYEQNGKVVFFNNQISLQTASIQIWVDFENPNNLLLPNAYVDVLVEEDIENAIILPQSLVSLKPEGFFVWIVDKDGKVKEQKISVSETVIDNSFYFVSSGLKDGDFVVLKTPSLKEGEKVHMKIIPLSKPVSYTPIPEK